MSHDLELDQNPSTLELVMRSAPMAAAISPRHEDLALEAMLELARDFVFVDKATMEVEPHVEEINTDGYTDRHGGDEPLLVPTMHFVREISRLWRHIHFGARILRANDEHEEIEAWAFDAQACKVSVMPGPFSKLKKQPKGKKWKEPEPLEPEDIIRERHALIGILKRRAVLDLIPDAVVRKVLARCQRTLDRRAEKKIQRDPDSAAKDLEAAWAEHGVTRAEIEGKLGRTLEALKVSDDRRLWGWLRSIREGAATPSKYFPRTTEPEPEPVREPEPDRRAGEPTEPHTTKPNTPDGPPWIPPPSAAGAALPESFWTKPAEPQST